MLSVKWRPFCLSVITAPADDVAPQGAWPLAGLTLKIQSNIFLESLCYHHINALATGRCGSNFKDVILKLLTHNSNDNTDCEIALRPCECHRTWWCHQMGAFSTLLALCVGNSPATGEFPSQRPVTWSFDVFFDMHLNKRLSKQSRHRLFEAPLCSLWHHCNDVTGRKSALVQKWLGTK